MAGFKKKTVEECFVDDFGTELFNVHNLLACNGRPCVIHNPSNHGMSKFKLLWRDDRRIFERICPHGVGHPDPDDQAFHVSQGRMHEGIHGCDGCCRQQPIQEVYGWNH